MSADRGVPTPPHPGGVVDLARYRGRVAGRPGPVPPPSGDAVGERSPLVVGPDAAAAVPVPAWTGAPEAGTESEIVVDLRDAPVVTPPVSAPTADGAEVEERVIRRVRVGSVARMAFGLSCCAVVVVVGAGVLIWLVLTAAGVVENVEGFAEDLGWTDVTFDGPSLLRSSLMIGLVVVIATTLLSMVAAEVFNLLSTITGGLRAEVGSPPPTRRQRRAARRADRARAAADR